MFVYFNGRFINEKNAAVSINNRSFRYGDGFFETIKCIEGRIPLWEYHVQRLFSTLIKLQFVPPKFLTPDYLRKNILDLIQQNDLLDLARVRITIYRGDGGIYDSINHQPNVLIQTWPLNRENNKLNENGLIIGEYTGGFKAADGFSNLKTNNYLLYAMAALYAKKMQWNDAIILNHKGHYADATIANLWIIRNNTILTPALSDGPVAGIMRAFLLNQLSAHGFTVTEQSISPSNLLEADEVFLSNAIYGIKWVKHFDNKLYNCKVIQKIHNTIIEPMW